MRIKETKVYEFSELSETAKEKARDWFRSGIDEDGMWADTVIEDAATIAKILGIALKTRPVKLMGGGTRSEPCIYWSGFSSQGDGASYEGCYSFSRGGLRRIRAEYPTDKELDRIALGLYLIQRSHAWKVAVDITVSGHYCHSAAMDFENIGPEMQDAYYDDVVQLLRDFADWIYGRLRAEWDYRNSEDTVDEDIKANGYEFTEDGGRA